jgi:6-O-methylguanine DNA methyltransferase, DNA binding domain
VVPCHRIVGAGGELVGYAGPRVDAEAQGLVPCTTCHPDLHPLTQ